MRWRITKFSLKSGVISIQRKNDLKEIAGRAAVHEGAICTLQEVIRIVHRPEEIENSAALTFFGGSEGDADES